MNLIKQHCSCHYFQTISKILKGKKGFNTKAVQRINEQQQNKTTKILTLNYVNNHW